MYCSIRFLVYLENYFQFVLQVTDAERRLQTATAAMGKTSKSAETEIAQLEAVVSEMDPDSNIVLISDIAGMKSDFGAAQTPFFRRTGTSVHVS